MTAIDRFLQLGDSVYHLTPTVEVAERREEVAPAEAEVESKQASTRQSRRQALAEERP